MDQFKTFIEIFERAVAQRNSDYLTEILRNSRTYFQNILKDDSESVLSMLFNENKGLLVFINEELKKSVAYKKFDKAIKEAFYLLKFIMEQFTDIFEPYIIEAKNACQLAIVAKCSAYIQKAACVTFNKLIELFKEYEIDLGETIKKFVNLFQFVDTKERSLLFSVLSTIAKYRPQIPEIHEYSDKIFQHLRNDFKKQYKPGSMSQPPEIFQVYLDVLSNILQELSSEVKEEHSEELYMWIKDLSNYEKYAVKKVSLRSAINLLFRYVYQFRTLIYRDYEFWYNLLIHLVQDKNAQCSECGQHALKKFCRVIANTLKEKTSEDDKKVFLYFKNLFEGSLKDNQNVNSTVSCFIVYGFSQMAGPCKSYLTNNDVRDMFSLLAHCALPVSSREDLERTDLENICNYQEGLSEIILHISGLSIDQINVILKLSILLVKRFPDLPIVGQNLAISSLINTIINIGIMNKNLLEEFLYNLIHDGVAWSCSHTLLVDAEFQRELKNLAERPTTYKNYLPLWLALLKPVKYKEHRQIVQEVVDSLIHVCIALISKLNLNTKTKEDNVFSDAAFSQSAENVADFRTFVNIVDLYVDLINELESPLFVNTISKFLLKVICMSLQKPLISGFYKLVRSSFKHICSLAKDEIEAEILEVLCKYFINVLNVIPTFSNELLTTCLYLILNAPILYVECILDSTIPAFKIAFTVGLSDFELACAALNALEQWTSHLENRQTKQFLGEVVPLLEPYLQSGESSVEFLQDIIKTERKVIKHIVLRDDENTLERFQMRVLSFIGSLDTDIIMNFVYKRSMDTGATWDKKDLLEYSMLEDGLATVYFDKVLPRLIVLAQNSEDRRTKITACEVLHSMIAFVLGETSKRLMYLDRYVPVYKILCPALLNLGCDYDEAARNLFQPLMLQLTHWLTSEFMRKSQVPVYFLDLLFKSLSNDSNSSLREFSGMCLAEFTKWSIKQSGKNKGLTSSIDEVIYKITNFAVHPSVSKRVAAAVAFNHLYTILREDEEIVSTYWLEIFYCFVKSLDGCNDPSIVIALGHVERVLLAKRDLLNVEHDERRKPHEFESATLTDAVNWLLAQTGCLDQCCRAKCMELVVQLAEYTANCDSAGAVINNYIEARGIETFNRIVLKDLNVKMESLSSNSILPLLRSFDCYIWLIRYNLLNVRCLFGDSNSKREAIFNCARNFVHVVNKIKLEGKDDDLMMLSKEFEDLQTLQCKTVMTMFNFLQILLNFDDNFLPNFFFNKDLFELISKCIICPRVLGFDTKNLEITERLPLIMENFVHILTRKADKSLFNRMKIELSIHVEKHANDFIDLDKILSSANSCGELKQYVRGLSFLERCNVLNQLPNGKHLIDQPQDKVTAVFNVLATERIGELVRVDIKPSVKEYLEILMEFLLTRYEPSMMKALIKLIENDTLLGPDPLKIEHGLHFLNTFKDVIFRYILKNTEKIVPAFDELLQGNPSFLLTTTELLFLYVQRHKKELHDCTETLVDTIVERFTMFERAVNNLEDRKEKLISIYGIAVHLKREPTKLLSLSNDFYKWILNQLTESSDMEHKIRVLRNFLVCLTDMTSDVKPELLVILRGLRNHRNALSPNDFSQKTVQALKVNSCFQTLLMLLPVTKSMVVFELVIFFAAGIAEELCDEKTHEYLQKYFNSITTEYALQSIETAYKLAMNFSKPSNERLDVLRRFLLPVFQFCKTAVIRRFFERNIREIHTIIRKGLDGNVSDVKQLVVSKIGCYDLVAIMFAKIPLKEIDNSESVITRNAVDNVVTGKELLQSLYSSALNVRALKTHELDHKELMRSLHCSAYNCSIAIVCLKKDEDSYVSIFAENRKKDQLIWDHIVNCDKQYRFGQTFSKLPKIRSKLTNIRKSARQKKSAGGYSYICSYDLSASTLNEDINAYDFNETVARDDKSDVADKEESMSLLFDCDELNNHECMASICGALSHMISEEISVLSTEDDPTLPKWLKCLGTSMLLTSQDNVQLFMLKIIWNMQTMFKHYAKFILYPIMKLTYTYLEKHQLNYIIVEIILMLIDWHATVLPVQSNTKAMAQSLWETVIHKVLAGKIHVSKSVYEYNKTIIRGMLEAWRTCLKLPENLSEKMGTAPEGAVYVILICFENGMEKDIVRRNDILEFLEKSLENWQDDEKTVLRCYECVGYVLKFLGDDDQLSNRKCALIDKIRSIMQKTLKNRQVRCILAICNRYPAAAMIYFEFVTANIYSLDSDGKKNCLKIFLLCVPNLTADQIMKELAYLKFRDLLINKVLSCEIIALRIIDSLVSVLPPSNILPLVNLVAPYTKHKSSEYREYAYGIYMSVHKKYATCASENRDARDLMRISKEMLLNGVLDPSEELQEKVQDFWSRSAHLSNTCKERILEILDTYTSTSGNNFLPFMFLMILDLTKKSPRYASKMYEPLQNCSYRDYRVAVSWRTRNLGSKAPLFAPSLASQMNQTFTQTSAAGPSTSLDSRYSKPSTSFNAELALQQTQEPEFESTFAEERPTYSTFHETDHDDTFKVPKVPEPAHNKKSRRFLSSVSEVSANIRQQEIKRNIRHHEMIKEESARQQSSVKLYRSYRIGDFPDIEISHAMLIEPLQQLAKRDQLICKDLTVSVVCSLLKRCGSDEFVRELSNSLKRIIEDQRGSNSTTAAILEIQLMTRVTNCSPEVIAKVSRSNNLNFLGSLVLEECLIHGTNDSEPVRKKTRNEGVNDSSNEWLQLTNLYESLNDIDVVLGIFQNHITDEDMQEASFAQAANNWAQAKAAYEKAYETESEMVKEHCLHGLFESLSNMCRWVEVDKHIENRLNGDIDNIWSDPWKDWMFPWLFEVLVHRLVDEDINDAFEENVTVKMQSWLEDDTKRTHLKQFFGEELSMFFLDKQVIARNFLLNTLDQVREQWISLHPLSTQLRIRKLQKLRMINDVNGFVKTLKSAKSPSDLQGLLKFWNNSVPSAQDAILPWDKLTSHRMYFIESPMSPLNVKLSEWNALEDDSESVPDREGAEIADKLHTITFNTRLKMIEAALNQKNRYVAKKYLMQLEQNLEKYTADMKHRFLLTGAKLKHLNGDVETTMAKKLSNYASAWKHCHNLLEKNDLDPVMAVHVRLQISKIASRIAGLSEEDETFFQPLTNSNAILKDIHLENEDRLGIRNSLEAYSLNHLKTCCDTTSANIKECYCTLSKYCYDRLSRGESDVQVSKEFVNSTLKAMSYGSLEAAHYFPCLLKLEYFQDEETRRIFVKESDAVQTWLYLSWQAQLFSHLGTTIAPLIIPILKRIVETYPNAVIYTFRLTVETNPALLNEARTYEIRRILYNRPEIDQFLLAMQYVAQPELYLQHHLLQFMKNLSLGTATAVDMLLKEVYPNARENKYDPKPGIIFNEIARYKYEIREMDRKKPEEVKAAAAKIIGRIKKSFRERKRDGVQLKDYSPWLHEFSARDIEIPGQYTGDRKPMPQYHAKIMKLEPSVKVMQSLRKPIRLTMVGNDAKEYHFLVKFGEDLRQDQRLQQLFTIMNKTLYIDAACRQRQLSIDTYQVIPLSRTVGLIQWIDNTRSLQELIHFTLSKEETKRYDSIPEKYEKWMPCVGYKEATMKHSATKVIAKMNEFIGKTEWDSLRKTLVTLCPSVESFVTMRRNFVTTYATMCIAHWILGIGDRHLGNVLIAIDSGRCLGIDFGLAFDAGIDQKIPELMPFRLTTQILGLLKPFTEKDLLGMVMIHALRALRNEQGPILSCMDVFVHEPLNWTEHVNKALRENEEEVMDIKWMPMKKIKAVTKKLNGIKPSLITLEQLKEQHNDKYFDRYYAIVTGNDDIKQARARIKDNSLTPEEQVECLLDLATDLNILGRSFVGWKPWL